LPKKAPIFASKMESTIVIVVLIAVIFLSLVLDLGLFTKGVQSHLSLRQSALRSLGWFVLGLASVVSMYELIPHLHEIHTFDQLKEYHATYGKPFKLTSDFETSMQAFKSTSMWLYFSGFLLEYALSIDNLFVMLLVFKSFKIKEHNERKILVWGVLGAMILRFIFIFLGSAAIRQFEWILYVFGALLVFSGLKLAFEKEKEEQDPANHFVMRMVKKVFPVSEVSNDRGHFFVRENGVLHVTVLFVVLLIIELTDVVFAIDSVPAVFGITRDPYLVFYSNIFAILGLRSLYFLIGHGIDKFWALKYGLSFILVFIGTKMLLEHQFHAIGFNHIHNLMVIIGVLSLSMVYSILKPQKTES
jgi:tellurite resistance protein TerC